MGMERTPPLSFTVAVDQPWRESTPVSNGPTTLLVGAVFVGAVVLGGWWLAEKFGFLALVGAVVLAVAILSFL